MNAQQAYNHSSYKKTKQVVVRILQHYQHFPAASLDTFCTEKLLLNFPSRQALYALLRRKLTVFVKKQWLICLPGTGGQPTLWHVPAVNQFLTQKLSTIMTYFYHTICRECGDIHSDGILKYGQLFCSTCARARHNAAMKRYRENLKVLEKNNE